MILGVDTGGAATTCCEGVRSDAECPSPVPADALPAAAADGETRTRTAPQRLSGSCSANRGRTICGEGVLAASPRRAGSEIDRADKADNEAISTDEAGSMILQNSSRASDQGRAGFGGRIAVPWRSLASRGGREGDAEPALEAVRRGWPSPLVAGAHLAVLWAFAVAQPLFDALAGSAEFFVARDNTSSDIVILSLVVTLVPPLALTAVELVASLIWPPLGRALHVVFVAVLGAAVVVGVLERIVANESVVLGPAAAVAGAAIGTGYVRAAAVRRFLTVLIPAPAIFLAVFLLFSPVSELVLGHEAAAAGTSVQSDTPVVLVIFDELPTISLMDAGGQIDAASYPSFGALAATSTWYRNATTVADGTFVAVPAILTGRSPRSGCRPPASIRAASSPCWAPDMTSTRWSRSRACARATSAAGGRPSPRPRGCARWPPTWASSRHTCSCLPTWPVVPADRP